MPSVQTRLERDALQSAPLVHKLCIGSCSRPEKRRRRIVRLYGAGDESLDKFPDVRKVVGVQV